MKTSTVLLLLSLWVAGCDCKSQATGGGGGGSATGGGSSSGGGAGGGSGVDAGASVLMHHNDLAHNGVYVDPALTHAAVATLHQDPGFSVALDGPTFAQPLFLDGLVNGGDAVLVATDQNVVALYSAADGHQVWKVTLATPVQMGSLHCGNIDPLGVTGTPVVDAQARTVYLAAMTTPDNSATKKHKLYALSLDDGSVRSGWPIDVEGALDSHSPKFVSIDQNQRGALALVDGVVYVPYGGHAGDCGSYYGWVVAVDTRNGNAVTAFNTTAKGGGIWNPGGVLSDGLDLFVTTGNTFNASMWSGGDAVLRLGRGANWSGVAADWWAPSNWQSLDAQDLDMGYAALVDVPGANPSALVAGFGKDGKIYLVSRASMGGLGGEVKSHQVANGEQIGAASVFQTSNGTFLVSSLEHSGSGANCPNSGSGNLVTTKIDSSLQMSVVWCGTHADMSVPSTSVTAPGQNPIVWVFGTNRLYAYDGETGDELFNGGGAGDTMTALSYFNTPVIAKGKVYVAAKNRLYRFVP